MIKKVIRICIWFLLMISLNIWGLNRNNPFELSTNVNNSLLRYSLSSMQMVGAIQEGDVIWGVIQTPDQSLYKVSVGENIDSDHDKINHITPTYITVEREMPNRELHIKTLWLTR